MSNQQPTHRIEWPNPAAAGEREEQRQRVEGGEERR